MNKNLKTPVFVACFFAYLLGLTYLLDKISNQLFRYSNNKIVRIIYIEYPLIFLAIAIIIIILLESTINIKNSIADFIINVAIIALILNAMFGYGCIFHRINYHTTLYSKLLLNLIIFLTCAFLIFISIKLNLEELSIIFIFVFLLLVPAAPYINECYGKFNVEEYDAEVIKKDVRVVTINHKYDHWKGTFYYINLKPFGENEIPVDKCYLDDFDNFDELNEGDIVKIETYKGILGLPAFDIKKY